MSQFQEDGEWSSDSEEENNDFGNFSYEYGAVYNNEEQKFDEEDDGTFVEEKNWFEKSLASDQHEDDEDQLPCLDNALSRFDTEIVSPKLPVYEDFMDFENLKAVVQQDSTKYKRCQLKIKSAHRAIAKVLDSKSEFSEIHICGRSKCGRTYMDDEVIVEVLPNTGRVKSLETNHKPLNDLKKQTEKMVYGRVIGMTKRVRYADVKHPILLCTLDQKGGGLLIPLCKTVPKISSMNGEVRKRFPRMSKYKLEIKTINKNGYIAHKKFVDIDPERREEYVFKVVILCWRRQFAYPLGAILNLQMGGRSYKEGLKILCMEYKVPKTFPNIVVNDTQAFINGNGQALQDPSTRRDLTSRRIFTIDPEESEDLDDALSVWTEDGDAVVGVHISDVAAFVRKGSAIDNEAMERAATFYPLYRKPHPMLPEPLSNDLLSLLPDYHRFAVSIFFKFDDSGNLKNDGELLIERTVINSKRKFSYAEAQKIIENEPPADVDPFLCQDILQLHTIASSLRRERLKDRRFFVPFKDPRLKTLHDREEECFEAHALVEEFMVLTNKSIAHLLKSKFSDVMILLFQKPPTFEQRGRWLEREGNVAKLVMKLQGKKVTPDSELSVREELPLQDHNLIVQKGLSHDLRSKIEDKLAFMDALHPLQCLASERWLEMTEAAKYKCSYGLNFSDHHHFGLDINCYTHFTSPIRRYADLHVQRLLHAYLDDVNPDYTHEEVTTLCEHLNIVAARQAAFEKRCVGLVIAERISTNPLLFRAYVKEVDCDQITLCLPSLLHVHDKTQEISFSMLGVSAQPQVTCDMRGQPSDVTVLWNSRIYNTAGTCRREVTLQHERNAASSPSQPLTMNINTHQLTLMVNQSAWAELLRALVEEAHDAITEPTWHTSDERAVVNVISSEKGDGTISLRPVLFRMSISVGQVFSVQMSAEPERGVLSLNVGLVQHTRNASICTRHLKNPVSALSRSSTEPTQGCVFRDYTSYMRAWLALLEMEAATEAGGSKDSVAIENVKITFQQEVDRQSHRSVVYKGHFKLPSSFCFDRCIEFGGTTMNYEEEVPDCPLDYLCIKYLGKCKEPTASQVRASSVKCAVDNCYWWVGHGSVMIVDQYDPGKNKEEKIVIDFILNYNCQAPPRELLDGTGGEVTVEILPKSPVSRQAQKMLFRLEDEGLVLPRSLAFGRTYPKLDERRNLLGMKNENLEVNIMESSLPTNNVKQKEAIKASLTNCVTLIQGPPGTGKTCVGVKLVYLFNKINSQLEKEGKGKGTILFCGPSNRSVDLVAGLLKEKLRDACPKIIRVYGSTIECKDYPDPKTILGHRGGLQNIQSDPSLRDISLHHVIRQCGKPYAEQIKSYDDRFRGYMQNLQNVRMSSKEAREYRKLLYDASVEELQHYQVILSTCSTGATKRVVDGTRGSVFQVIIDECAMSQEPHSLVPIVAHKAKQVVLIGDHKQLRPIVKCKEAARLGLTQSLFERLFNKSNFRKVFLTDQYRMHPQICEFPSNMFYEGKLVTNSSVFIRERDPLSFWPCTEDGEKVPHIFVDVRGAEETLTVTSDEGNERSKSNEMEAQKVTEIFKYLKRCHNIAVAELKVLTQYNAQRHVIYEKLKNLWTTERRLFETDGVENLDVSTVVSSQGGEWEYVILSTVRSLPPYMIEPRPSDGWCSQYMGFVVDQNQINVALTRARRGLIIVGNAELLRCDAVWRSLLDQYTSKGCFLDRESFPPSRGARR